MCFCLSKRTPLEVRFMYWSSDCSFPNFTFSLRPAAFQRDSVRSTEAGLKYFVLSALSSGLLLYGCSMIYGFAGTTQFDALAAEFLKGDVSIGLVVGLVFLLAGLVFKVSAVPFHMWTPDVYEGAPKIGRAHV